MTEWGLIRKVVASLPLGVMHDCKRRLLWPFSLTKNVSHWNSGIKRSELPTSR